MHSITILGSTGSIGRNTLDVIARHPELFSVQALTAHKNISLLFQQCVQFKPSYAVISDESAAAALRQKLSEQKIKTEVLCGASALSQAAVMSDIVVSAIVGAAGLLPTLSAIQAGKRVLLANKEALVMAAEIMLQAVREHHATLLPVDSEHNAIFQCLPKDFLPGKKLSGVESIILTASGGPFRTTPLEALCDVTPAAAIAHPNWKMGPKISIDSATMMNKGLEVIEAFWLFGLPVEKINVLIHPQSIIHSLVNFSDHSFLAQLGCPDMRIPIAYCLGWPSRITSGAKKLDLAEIARMDFEPLDVKRFPCVRFAYQALKAGGDAATILNAVNEVAVEAFCAGRILFSEIPELIDRVMQVLPVSTMTSLDAVLASDRIAREKSINFVQDSRIVNGA